MDRLFLLFIAKVGIALGFTFAVAGLIGHLTLPAMLQPHALMLIAIGTVSVALSAAMRWALMRWWD